MDGFRVFNADGSPGYDSGQFRLFRVLASINYGINNGSAGFTRQPQDTNLIAVTFSWYPPIITINASNNTVSWDFAPVPANYRVGGTLEIWAR